MGEEVADLCCKEGSSQLEDLACRKLGLWLDSLIFGSRLGRVDTAPRAERGEVEEKLEVGCCARQPPAVDCKKPPDERKGEKMRRRAVDGAFIVDGRPTAGGLHDNKMLSMSSAVR